MRTTLLALSLSLPLLTMAQLSGTYTVGGSMPDYPTLTAAVNALNNQGANGNVTFDIRPGTYTGKYELGTITGNPGTLTFRNASNGAQAVNLEHDASGSGDNYIFRIDGTDGITFDRLTFRPLDFSYARAIHFFNEILGLTITQCTFHGSPNPSGSAYFDRILVQCDQMNVGTNDNAQDVSITENSFLSGNTALQLEFRGFGGARSQNLLIEGNEFLDQVGTGINIQNANGEITGNLIATAVGNFYVALRTSYVDGGSSITRNTVNAVSMNSCTGLEIGNTQSTLNNLIANNMVYVASDGETWGLAVYNLWGMNIAHNSVLVADGDASLAFAFTHISNFPDGQDVEIRNNVFSNTSGGAAYNTNLAANINAEDHNDLFSSGAVLAAVEGTTYATLAAYQAATNLGQGDVDTDPVFPAQPDLHQNSCVLDGLGQYTALVPTDFDGQARNNPACDMGADEYTANSNAVQAPTITIQSSELPYDLGLNASFITYSWNTGSTTPTTTITQGGNYTCNVMDVNLCSYSVNVTVLVEISTTIDEVASMHGSGIFPNPAQDFVYLTNVTTPLPYQLYTMDGRIIRSGTLTTGQLAVSELPTGAYLLRLGALGDRVEHLEVQH